MNKEPWKEEDLENLFKQAPKVTDHRTKDEVLQRLIDEGVFNEQPPQQQKSARRGIRWTPLIASIASLFILVVVGAQFIGQNSISMDNRAHDEVKIESKSEAMEAEMANDESAVMSTRAVFDAAAQQTLVYESQLEGVTLFEVGLLDGAESIPVSFLIPNEVVVNNTGTEHPTKQQLYEAFASQIDETALGFSGYQPLQDQQGSNNYVAYQKEDGSSYLSPNLHMSYSTVEDALSNMTIEVNESYQTVILPEVTFHTDVNEDIVTITFDQPLDLTQFEPTAAMRMIEGMLLTAASFNKQIKFEQIVQENWSGFDFKSPLEKPIAANIVFHNFQ
ncbi:hypothetical protein MKX47_05955 [Solibacillus sp. FSL R7-0668]|uniref:hypothetical protein n=1 Tax=Solibacillus sp. FSL R7-0668 TaxID=2921688 RepID=UPI0030FCB81B